METARTGFRTEFFSLPRSPSPASWALVTLANGTHNYVLTTVISGTLYAGMKSNGVTVQLTVNTGKGFFRGQTHLAVGTPTSSFQSQAL